MSPRQLGKTQKRQQSRAVPKQSCIRWPPDRQGSPRRWAKPTYPEELASNFHSLPEAPIERRRTFIRHQQPEGSTIGTTWLTSDACLGCVNRSTCWTQRRTDYLNTWSRIQ